MSKPYRAIRLVCEKHFVLVTDLLLLCLTLAASACRAVMAQSLILSERLERCLGVSRVRASSQEASGSAL